jgi:hypothetical protein
VIRIFVVEEDALVPVNLPDRLAGVGLFVLENLLVELANPGRALGVEQILVSLSHNFLGFQSEERRGRLVHELVPPLSILDVHGL